MAKHYLFLAALFLLLNCLTAQEFDVREFKPDPSDITARMQEHQRRTVNDEPCALIKVITNIRGMSFESNIGIVDLVPQEDGYWLYIAPRERRIKLMAPGYLSLDVDMPEPARSHMVYSLVVASKGTGLPATELVQITFRMNQSNVYIRSGNNAPVASTGSNAVFNVPKGKHTFRFFKEGFSELEKTIDAVDPKVVEIELQPGQTQSSLALSGFIIINSEPQGAEIFLNEQRIGTTPHQGRFIAGAYNLRLRYPLYYDHEATFTLSEGETVNLPVASLKPRFGYWQISSTPSNAEVLLNGRPVGTTPLSRSQISSGNHELIVRSPLYHEHKENFSIADGDNKSFNISLKEAFGHLVITSDPGGAKVFIEGREVGTSPYENRRQPSGTYSIRLTKDLYSDTHEHITVNDGQKTERFIPLSKNFGTLIVNAPGADIYVNNVKVGSGSINLNRPPGQYKVKATKNLHIDDERDVFIVVGQTESLNLSPRPRQGGLSIVSEPFETRGAEIFINGQKRSETTPAVFPLLIGNYSVTVKKPGFLESTQSVQITEGRESELTYRLQTFEGSMLQKARRHKTAKIIYGSATIAAAGAGAYYRYSAMQLADDYKTATTDATAIYDKYERHDLYSYIAFGAAVPLGVMTIVKAVQQKKAQRQASVAFMPVQGGGMLSLRVGF